MDISGVFVTAPASPTAGRFASAVSTRLLDTRASEASRPPAGSVRRVAVAGGTDQPDAALVSAVVVNITATESAAPGFVQAAPGGTLVPGATSVLNLDRAGQTVAGLAVVPVAADGTIDVYTQAGAHLLVDLVGWFSSDAADPGTDGEFVAVPPERVLDTRPVTTVNCCYGDLRTRAGFFPDKSSRNDLFFGGLATPAPKAVFLNVTATDAAGGGYVQADAAGDLVEGATSVLNVPGAGATVPNAAVVPVGFTDVAPLNGQTPPVLYDAQGITLYSHGGAHLLVDLFGFFT